MAKGKMTGSPFHVENPRYLYAIEHETSPVKNSNISVGCPYLQLPSQLCNLWNSGRKGCDGKCLYQNVNAQVSRKCNSCSFFMERCFHPDHRGNITGSAVACYCSFYVCTSKAYDRIGSLENITRRLFLTEHLARLAQLINSKKRSIKREMYQVKNTEHKQEGYEFISRIQMQISSCQKMYDDEKRELEQIGGSLNAWPTNTLERK